MSCTREFDLAERWARYLIAHYRGTDQIMAAFRVSRRTAIYWEKQEVEPRGKHLAAAMRRHPDAIPLLIGAAP